MAARSVKAAGASAAPARDLTEDFSYTCLLLLLDERAATPPELCRRLGGLGLVDPDTDPMRVEEILGELCDEGLVRLADDGLHTLTVDGAQRLGIAADDLRSTQILLDRFLARCGERLVL